MIRIIQNIVTRKAALALAAVVGLGAIAAAPQPAQAGFRIGFDIRDGGRQPVYENRAEQVWVEPVYRTVCERVWVAPTFQTVSEQVWVPDRFEDRQFVRGYGWQRQIVCERVLVQPAHYELQSRQIQIADGHWANVDRQELIAPGHWETRVEPVACADPGPAIDHLHIEFGHR